MSGRGKGHGKKHSKYMGDVTLDDFANAKVCKSRPKKSVDSVSRIINEMKVDDRPWDEKIDAYDDLDFVQEENEDESTSTVMKRAESKRKKKASETSVDERPGVDYPIDIWFLISEFVRPQDVGRFAGICKATYAVACSAKFWFGLYRRYYKPTADLPERLQPECMVRLYGLRTCVIRALHYMYAPYAARALASFDVHPSVLVRRQCTLMWHKKSKDMWLFYFKLREQPPLALPHRRHAGAARHPDLTEMLQDVFANNEEGCRILQVACKHYVSVPPTVIGQTLSSVLLTLSQGFRHHRLHLHFGSGLQYATRTVDVSAMTEIVLDPVYSVRVLDWWHPLYPHNQTTPLLNQD